MARPRPRPKPRLSCRPGPGPGTMALGLGRASGTGPAQAQAQAQAQALASSMPRPKPCNADVHIKCAHLHRNFFKHMCCAKVGAPFLAVCAGIKTPCNGVLISAQTARKGAPHFCTTHMFEQSCDADVHIVHICTATFSNICVVRKCGAPFLAVCAEIKTPCNGVLISAQTARKGAHTFAQQHF